MNARTTATLTAAGITALVVLASHAAPARAADWVMLLGSEEGRAPSVIQPIGFVQVAAAATPFAEPVEGLKSPQLAPLNGATPTSNIDGVDVSVRRARLGARGAVPYTSGRLSYFFAVDAGQNTGTRGRGINVFDASLSLHLVPGARLRVGQFKLPIMDETLESNPLTADFINFSPSVQQLVLEQPVKDGAYAGPGFSNRDIGAQVFDSFLLPVPASLPGVGGGGVELAYAGMVSQGQTGAIDTDAHKDLSGRIQLSLVRDVRARYRPWREEVSLFAWTLRGARDFEGADFDRIRHGVGAHARAFGVRARVELVQAEGMLPLGQTPPFQGQPIVVDPRGTAWGSTFDLSIEAVPHLELNARLADLQRYEADDPRARHIRNVTLGAQLKWSESVKVLASWELRSIGTPPGAPPDARTLADVVGDLFTVQLTAAL